MPAAFQHLLIETSAQGVRTITLNRPDKLNAVNPVLENEFPQAVSEASEDAAVRCVVITGAGRGFCAGLELSAENLGRIQASTKPGSRTRSQLLDGLGWVGRWALAIQNCNAPVIAAINGAAAGAGFAMSLAADIRLVSDAARMTCGYARIGLSPDAGMSYFLPRLVGSGRAAEMLLTARDISAEEAVATGIAAARYPAEDFAASVQAYAARLAQGPTYALAQTKRLLNHSFHRDLETQLRDELSSIHSCFATRDAVEAVRAFGEKRKPTFEGK